MLTRNDLIAIGELFDEKFDTAFDNKVKPVIKKLNKIQKDLDTTISLFDRDIIDNRKRIENLEKHPYLKLKQV